MPSRVFLASIQRASVLDLFHSLSLIGLIGLQIPNEFPNVRHACNLLLASLQSQAHRSGRFFEKNPDFDFPLTVTVVFKIMMN